MFSVKSIERKCDLSRWGGVFERYRIRLLYHGLLLFFCRGFSSTTKSWTKHAKLRWLWKAWKLWLLFSEFLKSCL